MSDIDTEFFTKGGLFKGDDGKLSGRKLLGFFSGAICAPLIAIASILKQAEALLGIGLTALFLTYSLLMYKLLTTQSIENIIGKLKGAAT